jgi:ribose transport system permease protein
MAIRQTEGVEEMVQRGSDMKTNVQVLVKHIAGFKVGALAGLVVMILVLLVTTPSFVSINNFLNIIDQITINGIMAIGVTLVIIIGGIDLSVGSVLAFSMMTFGVLTIDYQVPYLLSVLAAILVGSLCGLVNGILVAKVKLPPFIATLSMMSIARGLANMVSGNTQRYGFSKGFAGLSGDRYLNLFSITTMLLIFLTIAFAIYMKYRGGGRSLYSIGHNEEVARLSGIKVDKVKILIYGVSGTLAGLAGVVLNSQLSSSQPYAGVGYELNVIAAVVIGGASLSGGVGTIGGTFIGAMIIGVLRNGLNLNGVNVFIQQILIGVVIAVTVAFDMHKKSR